MGPRKLVLFVVLAMGCAAAQQPRPEQPGAKKAPHRITPAEAQKLFAEVDEILQFVSRDTGLPIKQRVKRELTSREKLRAFIAQRQREDEQTKRLQRASVVLKKLGLLPRDFDLDQYLGQMLEEQVAGYYDAKTKTVYLLDWIEPEGQRPVLAHELTHALQDQNYDLEKSMKRALKQEDDRDKLLKVRGEFEVDADERATARQALTEGQAMVVLIDYMLAPSGKTLADAPMILDMFRASAGQMGDQYPMLAHAPQYLRESIVFPYTFGLDFVAELLKRGGKPMAFEQALTRPPVNTRHIMQPDAYASGEKIAPFRLPDMRGILGDGYEPYDVGNIGQFDVYSLMKQFAGGKTAQRLAPMWRGGAYYAARRKGGKAGGTDCAAPPSAEPKAAEAQRVACLAMLLATRWETPEAAGQWAHRYASLLLVKYRFAQTLADESARPPAEGEKAATLCFTCPGGERWRTDEGMVTIEQNGNVVVVLETFDDATTPKLQGAAIAAASQPGH